MARAHGIDRRRHARIKLPTVTAAIYPVLTYNGNPLPFVDVSIGGACVQDPKEILSPEIGHVVRLELLWPNGKEPLLARVVAASQHVRRHLHFQNLSASSLDRLSTLVRMGTSGQKMRQVTLTNGPVQWGAIELWTGLNGDSLTFFDTSEKLSDLSTCAMNLSLFVTLPPRIGHVSDPTRTRPARGGEVADCLVCLVNIPEPSPRVARLIETLVARSHQWLATGSGS